MKRKKRIFKDNGFYRFITPIRTVRLWSPGVCRACFQVSSGTFYHDSLNRSEIV